MSQFKDANGTVRDITFNVFTVEKIRNSVKFQDGTPVDLFAIADEQVDNKTGTTPTLDRIKRNPYILCQIVHCCMDCSFEEFAAAMDGDAIANAADAFVEELITLFPRSSRAAMQLVNQKLKHLEERLSMKAVDAVRSDQFDAALENELQQFEKRFGRLLDDFSSTQDR